MKSDLDPNPKKDTFYLTASHMYTAAQKGTWLHDALMFFWFYRNLGSGIVSLDSQKRGGHMSKIAVHSDYALNILEFTK